MPTVFKTAFAVALLFSALFAQGLTFTTVQDTMKAVDGTTNLDGTIQIAWPTYTAFGSEVPAGTMKVGVSNGALSVSLVPTDRMTCKQACVYTVTYVSQGKAMVQTWLVPTSAVPVLLAAVQNAASGGASPNTMTTVGDIVIGGTAGAPQRLGVGTNGQVLTSDGTAPAWTTPVTPSGGERVAWNFCSAAACGSTDAITTPWIAGAGESVTLCGIAAGTPPTGASLILQVKKNGTNAFTLTLTAGTATAVTSTPSMTVAVGDLVTAALTQVGSTVPGQYLQAFCHLQ
jgi:hypothetical protein